MISSSSLRFAASAAAARAARQQSLTSSPSYTALRLAISSRPRFCSASSSSRGSDGDITSSKPRQHHLQSEQKPYIMSSKDYLQQSHDRIFENNRKWAELKAKQDPEFFVSLKSGQQPEYLWIGCSDSRIPAEQIAGLEPGETFVHRNIANLVVNTDLNAMSVIEYAVRHLKVKYIIVCGHYGCGGVKAAMTPQDLGLLNPWLRNIRDVYRLHEKELDAIKDETKRYDRLVELNVFEQCRNVIKTAAVQQSYEANAYPIVHGWVFGFEDGLLTDLEIGFEDVLHDIQKIYHLRK